MRTRRSFRVHQAKRTSVTHQLLAILPPMDHPQQARCSSENLTFCNNARLQRLRLRLNRFEILRPKSSADSRQLQTRTCSLHPALQEREFQQTCLVSCSRMFAFDTKRVSITSVPSASYVSLLAVAPSHAPLGLCYHIAGVLVALYQSSPSCSPTDREVEHTKRRIVLPSNSASLP